MKSGIPTIDEYNKIFNSDAFRQMELFSDTFIRQYKATLKNYKWSRDALHHCSRVWEYPYVFEKITNYLESTPGKCILDAGSGVTFFPYFLADKFNQIELNCCDYDQSYQPMFASINANIRSPVKYDIADLHDLFLYTDNSFDIIYCISVLEHTIEPERIVKQFKRILKPNGILIITFDISLDGDRDIPIDKAADLLKCLQGTFSTSDEALDINRPDIFTTSYVQGFDPKLLPWRYNLLSPSECYAFIMNKFKHPCYRLTVSCHTFTKSY